MGTKRKTITITDNQDNWIKSQINAGEFTNDSEYIRDLIRRDQTSQACLVRSTVSRPKRETVWNPCGCIRFPSGVTNKPKSTLMIWRMRLAS